MCVGHGTRAKYELTEFGIKLATGSEALASGVAIRNIAGDGLPEMKLHGLCLSDFQNAQIRVIRVVKLRGNRSHVFIFADNDNVSDTLAE